VKDRPNAPNQGVLRVEKITLDTMGTSDGGGGGGGGRRRRRKLPDNFRTTFSRLKIWY
jgi:hypothetical protein